MFRTNFNNELKQWTGLDSMPVLNPKVSLGEIVLRTLFTNASRIAQISDDSKVQMTFDEIRIKAIRAAKCLQQLGYKPNDMFGLMARNWTDVAPIVFASLFNACPLNTLDPNFGKLELIHMLKTTKPRLMFCDVELYDLVAECLTELGMKSRIFTFGGQTDASRTVDRLFTENGDDDEYLPVKVDGENHVAAIVCSSGTTGLAKGVCLSHAVLADSVKNFSLIHSDDVILCYSPLFWISGLLTLLTGTIKGCKRIITTENFSPELQFQMVKDYNVTYIMSSPYHVGLSLKSDQLKSADLSSVVCQVVGGSKVPVEMPEQWSKYLKEGNSVSGTYGFSEAGGPVTLDYPRSGKEGSVGPLCPGFIAKIIDENGKRCGTNVDGEICTKPPIKFLGYFGNEKATSDLYDSEGFMMTGDIGHFDDDGYLYFVDRKKDLLKYRNHQLTPGEIEDFLILQRPEIDSVCVVGIPDGNGSDLPAAVVIRRKNMNISEEEISQSVADHFADYYKLRGGVYFVESFPMSSAGKLLRRKVLEFAIELFNKK